MRNRVLGSMVAVAAAVSLAACGSSGSSSSDGVSTSQLTAKLKSEPSIKQVTSMGGASAKFGNELVDCIATALKKNASQSDLSAYVSGKKSLAEVGGNSSGAEAEAKACAAKVVKEAQSGG